MKKIFTLFMMAAVAFTANAEKTLIQKGDVYCAGLGTDVVCNMYAEEGETGETIYTIENWYGPGSLDLRFTLDENGTMTFVDSYVYALSGSYTYLYTGLDQASVYFHIGYVGYDCINVYTAESAADGTWVGVSEITKDTKVSIWIKGYWGAYSYEPYQAVTDPNDAPYWTYDTKVDEGTTAIQTPLAPKAETFKTAKYIFKNGQKFNYAGQRIM